MQTSKTEDRILQTERHFSSSPEEIYAAFADSEALARWWGPNGFTNTFSLFEFSEGGVWEFIMHDSDGRDYPNRSIFQKIEPSKLIVIQHVSVPHFTLSVMFSPCDSGTHLRWVQEFEDPKVVAAVRHIAEPGNEQNLDRLQLELQRKRNA